MISVGRNGVEIDVKRIGVESGAKGGIAAGMRKT